MALTIAEIVQQAIQGLQTARGAPRPVSTSVRPGASDMQQILDSRISGPRAEMYFSGWRLSPRRLSIHSRTPQQARPGTAVAEPPAVVAYDAHRNPVVGLSVVFTVTEGEGRVTVGQRPSAYSAIATTDVRGLAELDAWTLGNPGLNVVIAEILGHHVTFVADAV